MMSQQFETRMQEMHSIAGQLPDAFLLFITKEEWLACGTPCPHCGGGGTLDVTETFENKQVPLTVPCPYCNEYGLINGTAYWIPLVVKELCAAQYNADSYTVSGRAAAGVYTLREQDTEKYLGQLPGKFSYIYTPGATEKEIEAADLSNLGRAIRLGSERVIINWEKQLPFTLTAPVGTPPVYKPRKTRQTVSYIKIHTSTAKAEEYVRQFESLSSEGWEE